VILCLVAISLIHSSLRHCPGSAQRGACAADDVTRRATKLYVDDTVQDEPQRVNPGTREEGLTTVQDEVDGKVDEEETVGDDGGCLVGVEHVT